MMASLQKLTQHDFMSHSSQIGERRISSKSIKSTEPTKLGSL